MLKRLRAGAAHVLPSADAFGPIARDLPPRLQTFAFVVGPVGAGGAGGAFDVRPGQARGEDDVVHNGFGLIDDGVAEAGDAALGVEFFAARLIAADAAESGAEVAGAGESLFAEGDVGAVGIFGEGGQALNRRVRGRIGAVVAGEEGGVPGRERRRKSKIDAAADTSAGGEGAISGEEFFEQIGLGDGVVVDVCENGRLGRTGAGIAGMRQTGTWAENPADADAVFHGAEGAEHGCGVIGGGIIDYDDFAARGGQGLAAGCHETTGKKLGAIVSADDE